LCVAAIGQYIAVRASSFRAIGGYEAVKKMTTEDMYIARKLKIAGYKTLFIDVECAARCRMYTSYKTAVDGIGKNIFDFFERRSIVLFVIFFAVLIFMVFPPYFALFKVIQTAVCNTPPDTLTLCLIAHTVLIYFTWLLLFATQKLSRRIALLYPLLFVNLMFMAIRSWYKALFGAGFLWKGRIVK
jgi:chlorobactene glucosyltransferase